MPVRRRPDVSDQTSILQFVRPKQRFVPEGIVINVADTDGDADDSGSATLVPPFTRRRIINDDDDDVPLLSTAPSQPLHPSVDATPIPVIQQTNSQSLRAPSTLRPDATASNAAMRRRECELDACQQYEDEVFAFAESNSCVATIYFVMAG